MSDIALGVVGFGGQGCQSMLVTHIDLHIGGSSREALVSRGLVVVSLFTCREVGLWVFMRCSMCK